MLCAGAGQAIALHNDQNNGQSGATFWRRWCQIAGCAVLVSIGSSYMFPGSWIYFGVLHGIATMLLVCRLTASWGRWLWLAGAAAALVGVMAPQIHAQARDFWPGSEILNGYMLNWLGLVSRKPITEDYVPLLPWMGVMWWGMAGARWVLARGGLGLFGKTPAPAILHAAPGLPALAWIGRWSLTWYMLHQPLLIGLLTVVKAL